MKNDFDMNSILLQIVLISYKLTVKQAHMSPATALSLPPTNLLIERADLFTNAYTTRLQNAYTENLNTEMIHYKVLKILSSFNIQQIKSWVCEFFLQNPYTKNLVTHDSVQTFKYKLSQVNSSES